MIEEVILIAPKHLVYAAALAGFLFAASASAQSVVIISGNGQMICTCAQTTFTEFDPIIVQVNDANGNPIPDATVNWAVTSLVPGTLGSTQTFTGVNGQTPNFYFPAFVGFNPSQPFIQSTITATYGSSVATFTLTQITPSSSGTAQVYAVVPSPTLAQAGVMGATIGSTITGSAGSTASVPVTVSVQAINGTPVPNIAVLLAPNSAAGPATASCAATAGAGPGTVFTDSTGNATCMVVLGASSGAGQFSVVVGGVASDTNNGGNGGPAGYQVAGPFNLQVTAGTPTGITIVSGNNQSANPGQALALPLVAEVTAASGGGISGQTVNWTVTPSTAGTLASASTTSISGGTVSNTLTLSSSAAGAVTVTASLASAPSISASFSVTANTTITGITILSGNSQSALPNAAFSSPLIVQVNGSNGQPLANFPVQFSVSGPATLSATSATTGTTGQAQVTATAGATAGAVTVTATAGSFSATFTLTVLPPGPSITSSSFLNGAGFFPTDSSHAALSPCGITTIVAPGVAPGVQGVVVANNIVGPLPYTLAGDQVSFNGAQAPIYNVANVNGQQSVTVQVPCSVAPGTVPATVSVSGSSATVNVTVKDAGPGIFQTTMSDGVMRAVLVRPDGSFVELNNPARLGETITMYATGLGVTSPAVGTNQTPIPGTSAQVQGQIIVGVNNSGVQVVSAQAAPGMIGVYQVAFVVPSTAPTGNNIVLSLAINTANFQTEGTQFSNGSLIPIQ
jgi:uncharacterized protein (TIGR03437 family)